MQEPWTGHKCKSIHVCPVMHLHCHGGHVNFLVSSGAFRNRMPDSAATEHAGGLGGPLSYLMCNCVPHHPRLPRVSHGMLLVPVEMRTCLQNSQPLNEGFWKYLSGQLLQKMLTAPSLQDPGQRLRGRAIWPFLSQSLKIIKGCTFSEQHFSSSESIWL